MKYFFIAGEASGDLHGANLVKVLREADEGFSAKGWGGDRMKAAGVSLLKHYRELAFMGFWEVLENIGTIRANFADCKRQIARFQPDAVVLIDYSGFNLRIAKWIHEQGIRVVYYISPQLWASRKYRIRQVQQYVDLMLVILPFEEKFYQKNGITVRFVGHPLLDAIGQFQPDTDFLNNQSIQQPVIALLPGSRRQEISSVLPVLLPLADQFPEYQFVVGMADSIPPDFYQKIAALFPAKATVMYVANQTYDLLSIAKAAIVTSGTATLETALFRVPQVVVYKANWLTYQIARRIVKVPYISLVNLIADCQIVPELIQNDCTTNRLIIALSKLLEQEEAVRTQLSGYQKVVELLGGQGASSRAAKEILAFLKAGD